jgi:hypothetical protein
MEEEKRKKKWGRYGRVKYVYQENQMQALERHMREQIARFFPMLPSSILPKWLFFDLIFDHYVKEFYL